MLKNKLWIVALFAALTMAFIGCTDAAHDWTEPKEEFEENVLQILPKQTWAGFDLKYPKFEFQAGDEISISGKALAANTVHMSRNHQAWAPIWEKKCSPDEEFSGKVTLTKEDVASIAGLNPPAIRVYGNTINGTYIIYDITVTRDGKAIYSLKAWLQTLEVGETDYTKIFDNEWIAEASDAGKQAVYTILGPGAGAEADKVFTYKGAAGKVVYTKDADTEVETVVDSDPSVTANGVDIIEADEKAGIVSMKVGSTLHYKFPTSATGAPVLDLEADWDYIDIEYTVSNVDKTSGGAGNFKARFFQYDSTTAYGYGSSPADMDGNGYANLGAEGTGKIYKIQTWGAGGKGGFTIGYNQYDVASSGADSLKIKITKVTFTKGKRYTVSFNTPQTAGINNYPDLKVLSGNSLGSRMPVPKNPGWAFLGWLDDWDMVNFEPTGNPVSSSTAITSDLKLYANWMFAPLPVVSQSAASLTTTLFSAVDSYAAVGAAGQPYVYKGRAYWIISQGTSQGYSWTSPAKLSSGVTAEEYDAIAAVQLTYGNPNPAYTRIVFKLEDLSEYWMYYGKVTITYDFVALDGDNDNNVRAVQFRNSLTAAGGTGVDGDPGQNNTPWLTEGNDNTITWTIGNFDTGGYAICNNNADTAKLLRISKIELHF